MKKLTIKILSYVLIIVLLATHVDALPVNASVGKAANELIYQAQIVGEGIADSKSTPKAGAWETAIKIDGLS